MPFASTDPQAAPPHPCPATPLWTLHVTPVFVVFVTLAKNCCVLSVAPDAGTNAYAGDTVTATGPEAAPIVINATPLRETSAWLVAVSTTGFIAGANAGARKSTLPETGPAGGVHGFVPDMHTWPTLALPLGMLLTDQVTLASGVFPTVAVNDARWLNARFAEAGETLTLTLLVIVTLADASIEPAPGKGAVA